MGTWTDPGLLGWDGFFPACLFELSQQLNLMLRLSNNKLIASDEMRFVCPAYPGMVSLVTVQAYPPARRGSPL